MKTKMFNSLVQRLAVLLVLLFVSVELSNIGLLCADDYVDDAYFQPELSFEQQLKNAENLTPKYDRNMKEFIFQPVDTIVQDTTQLNPVAL